MQIFQEIKNIVQRSLRISLELYKIMIPIIIGVKILQEVGLIFWLAKPLSPIMHLVGLPGEMGLVWATAMINTIYASMIVFVSLAGSFDLTVAQVTVLCTMILVAHGLPIELEIVRKAGPRMGFQALLRIGGALVLGLALHHCYSFTAWLQQPNVILWESQPESANLWMWGLSQVQNLAMIFVIILILTAVMRIFTALGITHFCVRLLAPVLRSLGVGAEAGTLTIVGMVMGLSYGGGMIMHEARSGHIADKDIFSSLSLMGLSHSVFEDTLLMAVLGAHISGLLWARIFFTLLVVAALVRLVARLGDSFFYRYLFKPVKVFAQPEPCCPTMIIEHK
ncbi:MAG: hypothetical protein GX043_07195 [Desulfovibrionales bacterium]|jgi:hypothetical protein|nr:hypothetical protein [Desulfovibrionales bacterium]